MVEQLDRCREQCDFVVVHGPTGSGKSRLLAALARAGAQVLDLEALAAHRGSVLGGMPGEPQPTQKWFESQLLAESRASMRAARIRRGRVEKDRRDPGTGSADGAHARLTLPASRDRRQTRVTLLLDEYRHFLADRATLEAQLDCLIALHGREGSPNGKRLPRAGNWREFVARLLAEHYDPAYQRSSQRNFAAARRSARRAHPAPTRAFDAAAADSAPV